VTQKIRSRIRSVKQRESQRKANFRGLNLETGAKYSRSGQSDIEDENTWTWTDTVASSTFKWLNRVGNGSSLVDQLSSATRERTDNIDVYYDTIYKIIFSLSSGRVSVL